MKLSRKQFYKNHMNEISKYLSEDNSVLHISSNLSEVFELEDKIDTLTIDPKTKLELELLKLEKDKYDLIIVTDIFEVSSDIYSFVKFFKNSLTKEGKVLLTSINPKWNFILKFFELLKLKRNSNINAYIKPSKISNIFNSLSFEKLKSYNRQIFPFSFFGIGRLLNIFLELFLSIFNIGIKTYFLYQLNEAKNKTILKQS